VTRLIEWKDRWQAATVALPTETWHRTMLYELLNKIMTERVNNRDELEI
jgi:hypothetical protein